MGLRNRLLLALGQLLTPELERELRDALRTASLLGRELASVRAESERKSIVLARVNEEGGEERARLKECTNERDELLVELEETRMAFGRTRDAARAYLKADAAFHSAWDGDDGFREIMEEVRLKHEEFAQILDKEIP